MQITVCEYKPFLMSFDVIENSVNANPIILNLRQSFQRIILH